MSAAPDPELAKRLLNEVRGLNMYETFGNLSEATALLYLVNAILAGNWCDFGYPLTPRNASCIGAGSDYFEGFTKLLERLPCFPLLKPYFEPREYTPTEIDHLRVAHSIAAQLEGKTT